MVINKNYNKNENNKITRHNSIENKFEIVDFNCLNLSRKNSNSSSKNTKVKIKKNDLPLIDVAKRLE